MSAVVAPAAAALLMAARLLDSPSPGESARTTAEVQPAREKNVLSGASVPRHGHGAVPPSAPERLAPEAIEQSLADTDPAHRDLVIERTLPQLVNEDAYAAARFAERQRDPFLREAALRSVATRWASVAPDAASLWAVSLPDEAERDQAIEDVALELAGSDAPSALNLLERRSRGSQADAATAGVITNWAGRDFDAALAWTETQARGPGLDEILQRLLFLKANTDPAAAIRMADRLVTDEAAQQDVFASIAQVWASNDPDGAREWAASLAPGVRRRVEDELALSDHGAAPTQ